jgi:phosphatidylserine decarboxylase precursor-related protein
LNFAREGYLFIGIALQPRRRHLSSRLRDDPWALWLLALVVTIIALWVAYFFRDPERTGERGPRVVVAPADGKLILITEIDEPSFVGGKALRLSIFMNVFNVHVNRYPIDGTVKYLHYNKGKFLNAAAEKSSLENEQSSVGIESGPYRILVRQIAGLIARRIVTYSRVGDTAKQGERMGMIRFGSRVDVFIPTDSKVLARLGTMTTAGTTVLAELPQR